VIVVDDGSPVPAAAELSEFHDGEPHIRVTVIEQQNAGPGAARNAALDAVPSDVTFVAFLDSDDEWHPDHLHNAVRALSFGYDLYFSDFRFPDYKEKSAFVRAEKIEPQKHRLLDQGNSIYEYCGNMIDQILVVGNVIGTSNVVYRFATHRDLRFREAFYNGQDYLFWLDFSCRTSKFVFSTKVECECGLGLNIYSGAAWGTARLLNRLKNELKLWHAVRELFSLTKEQDAGVLQRIASVRESIVLNLLHRLTHAKWIPATLLYEIARIDPYFPAWSTAIALRIAHRKLFRPRASLETEAPE